MMGMVAQYSLVYVPFAGSALRIIDRFTIIQRCAVGVLGTQGWMTTLGHQQLLEKKNHILRLQMGAFQKF